MISIATKKFFDRSIFEQGKTQSLRKDVQTNREVQLLFGDDCQEIRKMAIQI